MAVVQAPRSALAWGRLGEALHVAEFHAEAILCYSNAAALDSGDPRWRYLLGTLELQDRPEAGLDDLKKAADLARGQSEAPRFALARALIERGDNARARLYLEALIAQNWDHAAAHLELARIHMLESRYKEATAELQWAMTNQFTMRQAYLLGAQIAQRNNQADVAQRLSQRALTLPRGFDWPDPYLKEVQRLRTDRVKMADQANALLQQQRLPDAELVLEKLRAAFPNDPEGILLSGRLRYLQRRCPEAEALFRRHLELERNSLNGLMQLGLALMCQERWTNAAATFEQAIALKPDYGAAHHNLGVARSRQGNADGAIQAFRDATRYNPGDVNVLFALAEELANAGQIAEAKDCIRKAESLAPADRRLARAKQELGM